MDDAHAAYRSEPAPVRPVSLAHPLRWLSRGWADFRCAPGLGIAQGAVFLLGGALIALIGWGHAEWLAGAFSGFLLVAPALLGGFYVMSRARETGQPVDLDLVLRAWRLGSAALWRLGLLMALLGTLWVGLSALIIIGWAGVQGGGVRQFLLGFVASAHWQPFVAWLVIGGVFAALVFAISAVSVPMLLDRDVGLRCALLTSVRAVGTNPEAMFLWAALVMAATLVSLALVVPLLLLVPVLGHATWHAYRDTVDSAGLPARP